MTWEQWVNSDYNTIGASKALNLLVSGNYINIPNYNSNYMYNVIYDAGKYVNLTDLIKNDYSYTIYTADML